MTSLLSTITTNNEIASGTPMEELPQNRIWSLFIIEVMVLFRQFLLLFRVSYPDCVLMSPRAVRPLLTLYVSLQSAQENSGMREYHAVFLEILNLSELKKKLAARCGLTPEQIVAVYRYVGQWLKVSSIMKHVCNVKKKECK